MQGSGYEVVVLHYEYPAKKQMRKDQLACKVKYVCIKFKAHHMNPSQHYVLNA